MKYVGIHTQQASNNMKSLLLLLLFPCILLGVVYVFLVIVNMLGISDPAYGETSEVNWAYVNYEMMHVLPWVVGIVGLWFLIAYFMNTSMVRRATGARPLERRENPRVYNIVENLTMACGMPMPKVNVIDDPMLNAFASGIDDKSYTVTVTTGICDRLNDEELAGVIGHELTHIRNRDTRLLIISIIFVGIMSTIMSLSVRLMWNNMIFGTRRRDEKNSGGGILLLFVVIILSAIGYFFTLLTRFAISRKREYMADAGGAELCGNPLALASALRKISAHPGLGQVQREDVAQLFIIHPKGLKSSLAGMIDSLFSTHPSTESRIAYLEQF
ncbi:MAG: M48 family metallopeptidase [Paraprevotella sp.]|nr:M48 family metallopeptidase [Bacteroidaceae bacterium]MCI6372114.1 M48 family metallopeptidase [Paraprevotella sp.]MCI6744660.1 M48 family metallopeptidase [Paraprevotella sp.]MCI7081922.1 M48 family metallopeptidase [Paraprevotella sp.]MCI7142763.1 M48 family metallopeptidase [Paraprevotella sp.]